MPYVITTTTPFHRDPNGDDPIVARRAVADLIAAEYDTELLIEDHGGSIDEWPDVPEEGGTIGPLPDGTVIEVRPVGGVELADLAGVLRNEPMAVKIAAFNRSNA